MKAQLACLEGCTAMMLGPLSLVCSSAPSKSKANIAISAAWGNPNFECYGAVLEARLNRNKPSHGVGFLHLFLLSVMGAHRSLLAPVVPTLRCFWPSPSRSLHYDMVRASC